jgi:chaperonin GroES
MSGFTPLYDRLLVRPLQAETRSGNLFIPESAKEKPLTGEVIETGGGRINTFGGASAGLLPLTLKKGDTVVYGKFGHNEIKLNGETYLIMRESDVFGVLEGE